MAVRQELSSQSLQRAPEPHAVTDLPEHVVQYDRVMSTKLALTYAFGLEVVHRARPEGRGGLALDLACGPGYFTLSLARFFDYQRVIGIDLSLPMIEAASKNASEQRLRDRTEFRIGDATSLPEVSAGTASLVSFTGAAHQMPDLPTVTRVFEEMERMAASDGLIFVMDLHRLRSAKLTERYVNTLGADYIERGLPRFYDDFHDSMYAAWTAEELAGAIPRSSLRSWWQLVPRGLPMLQILIAHPIGQQRVFARSGVPWGSDEEMPLSADMHREYRAVRNMVQMLGRWRRVTPTTG
jgi:ubiquinone/menaquinone biosynthesis C-methylase UbiE